MSEVCLLCHLEIVEESSGVSLGKKGVNSLMSACQVRGEVKLGEKIVEQNSSGCQIFVHKVCRKRFTDLRKVSSEEKESYVPVKKKTRSSDDYFNWETQCFICTKTCDRRHNPKEIHRVETLPLRQRILDSCARETTDPFFIDIASRLQTCIDLVAVKASYHEKCMVRVLKLASKSNVPLEEKSHIHDDEKPAENIKTMLLVGRPPNPCMINAFTKTCEWLQSTAEPLSLQELEEYMMEIAGEENMCTRRWLQEKLVQTFGENIKISFDGYRNIVYLKGMETRIINDKWYAERKANAVDDKDRVVKAAAKIILSEIREMKYDKNYYPPENSIANVDEGLKCLPESLRLFLSVLIKSDVKRNSLGRCLVNAAKIVFTSR